MRVPPPARMGDARYEMRDPPPARNKGAGNKEQGAGSTPARPVARCQMPDPRRPDTGWNREGWGAVGVAMEVD